MGRTARRCRRFRSRCARFELLEPRQYLAANQALTTDLDVQQMPSIAVNPLDPEHLVVAYMDYSLIVNTGYAGIAIKVSHDGGITWSERTSIPLLEGFEQGAANPTVRFDTADRDSNPTNGIQNNLYVSFMAATFLGEQPPLTNPGGGPLRAMGFQANNGIFVSRSEDGGMSWEDPASVSSHIYIGAKVPFDIIPDLAIDTSRTITTQDGRQVNPMYAVFSRYYAAGQYPGEADAIGGSNIIFAASQDGGRNWQEKKKSHPAEAAEPITVIFNDGKFSGRETAEGVGFENWAHVAVGPQGDIYVTQFAGASFHVHHSTNGGNSFDHPDPENGALLQPFGINIPTAPYPGLEANSFRLQSVRAIAADPTRPGFVYVAEANPTEDAEQNTLDESEVVFSYSTDYGVTWHREFSVGAISDATVVNDDNRGQSSTGSPDDVASAQAMPRLITDAAGNVALIWYDTRRDTENHQLDVYASFGRVGTDGQMRFSPNFRVTDTSFDADAGMFADAVGGDNFYFGDTIGMALAKMEDKSVMYAAWTDTRQGNQDIFFSRIELDPLPAAPNDRFEPNDQPEGATHIGPDPVFDRRLPQLKLVAGEDDWFRITSPTGQLSVNAQSAGNLANLNLEIRDASGVTVIASGGSSINARVAAGQEYLIRAHSTAEAGTIDADLDYALQVATVTDVLGEVVYQIVDGAIENGEDAYYVLESKVAGSVVVALNVADGFSGTPIVEVADLKQPNKVLARSGRDAPIAVTVLAGQKLLVRVAGGSAGSGAFQLELVNLDQWNTTSAERAMMAFATGDGPSEAAVADLNGDGAPDIALSHVGRNIVSVLLNNGDGTYQAPREFGIGAFQQQGPYTLFGVPNFHRDLAVANFNPGEDSFPDILVVNTASADVSLLLGNGDGTFQPQRRFDATGAPFALAVGDVNNDGIADFVAVDSSSLSTAEGMVRLGVGNGTFRAPIQFSLRNREEDRTNSIRLVDVNRDGNLDLIERDFRNGTTIMLGNGDGTFRFDALPFQVSGGPGIDIADLNKDGHLDVVITRNNTYSISYNLGNGDGTFRSPSVSLNVGQFPIAVEAVDFGSAVQLPDGTFELGPPDGFIDLVVANNGHTLPLVSGPAEIVILAGLVDEQGNFAGFSEPILLASAKAPLDVKVENVNPQDDNVLDIVVVDPNGVTVLYGNQPVITANDTQDTARDLGTVVHLVQPTLTITPGHDDAWFKLRVPTEDFAGAKEQILDFSAGFTNEVGDGLVMQILDAAGNVKATGDRVRIAAQQDEELFVHISGVAANSAGAYTLVVNVLPQVAAIEAQSLLPGVGGLSGGPTTSMVLVFQGDRLDVASAENLENYHVIWLGNDGVLGGGDDREIPIGADLPQEAKAVIYNPSRNNVDAASGRSIPTALRQTVTLLFGEPLPAGNYVVQVSGDVMSSSFNIEELDLLSSLDGVVGHAVVSIAENGQITEGVNRTVNNVVLPAGALDLTGLEDGTSSTTQTHNDLGALLDSLLTTLGDDPEITEKLLQQIIAIIRPALLGANGELIVSLSVVLVDPTSIGLVAPDGSSLNHDLSTNTFTSNLRRTFIEVGGNVELIVIADAVGEYNLSLEDVPARARAGVVHFGPQGPKFESFTTDLRAGKLATTFVADGFILNIRSGAQGTARHAAPTVVAFAAPTFLPTFVSTSFVTSASRFTAVVPSLLLTAANRSNSAAAGNALLRTFGSGGSTVSSLVRAAEEAWDVVFSGWDQLTQVFADSPLDDEAEENPEDTGDSPAATALEQAWQSFSDAIGEMFAPKETADAASGEEQQTSRSLDDDATADQAGTEGNLRENTDSSAATARPGGDSADQPSSQSAATATPDKPGPSDTSSDNQEDSSHATAA